MCPPESFFINLIQLRAGTLACPYLREFFYSQQGKILMYKKRRPVGRLSRGVARGVTGLNLFMHHFFWFEVVNVDDVEACFLSLNNQVVLIVSNKVIVFGLFSEDNNLMIFRFHR